MATFKVYNRTTSLTWETDDTVELIQDVAPPHQSPAASSSPDSAFSASATSALSSTASASEALEALSVSEL